MVCPRNLVILKERAEESGHSISEKIVVQQSYVGVTPSAPPRRRDMMVCASTHEMREPRDPAPGCLVPRGSVSYCAHHAVTRSRQEVDGHGRRVALSPATRGESVSSVGKRKNSAQTASRKHELTVAETEEWQNRYLLGAENARRTQPADEDPLKDEQIKRLGKKLNELARDLDTTRRGRARHWAADARFGGARPTLHRGDLT